MSGQRVSPEAISRNRKESLRRYHGNRDHARKVQKEYAERKYEERPFIGWDSEGYDYFIVDSGGVCEKGPQRTMLFGCSVPGEYITGTDLSTREMLDLVLRVESLFPDAFHVGFAFEYDVNQMLKDLPWRMLAVLKITGKVRWNGYRINHVPHKIISVSKDGISATIYDTFGFFHCKYTTALEKYGVGDSVKLRKIADGKLRRGQFTWADIAEVTDYWEAEISLLPDLMEHIRTAAYGGGFRIGAWHGPGALASYGLLHNGVRQWMSKNVPRHAQQAIRAAYAGGRFQAWRCGLYLGDVYTLDKNSAYVQGMSLLPRLNNGKWERVDPGTVKTPGDIARFGLYHISFDDYDPDRGREHRSRGIPERPYPLFHRDKQGRLTWPNRVDGWYWSPEARLVAGDKRAKFLAAIVYRDDGTYPFKWVNDSYEMRVHLQQMGSPAEKAYKWSLAAYYGSFARRVGWNRRDRTAPRSHELAWAGFITSHCRAAIFDAASYAASKGALISVDTDGVTSTVPFPEALVPEGFSDKLGAWKQDHYTGILYWQNGIYWLHSDNCPEKQCPNYKGDATECSHEWSEAKSRGVPKGAICVDDAMEALENGSFVPPYRPPVIKTRKHKYIGYRQALAGQHKRWRVWVTENSDIIFGGTGKGTHLPVFCQACKKAGTGTPMMHTITHLPPKDLFSTEHVLPWLVKEPDDKTVGAVEEIELGSDVFGTANEIFADGDLDDRL
jgi:hypothetical protein